MRSLFYSSLLSSRLDRSLGLPSPSGLRAVPGTGFKQKEKGAGKEKNTPPIRDNIRIFFSLLTDFSLFYLMLLAVGLLSGNGDMLPLAGEIFLCALLGVKASARRVID
ncbi:MAG: hypothetical protein ACL93V_03820 [Candidatus Electrothrix sp. YB6]